MQNLNFSTDEMILAKKMRNDFIAVASHELKTPVTALKLQVQMVKRLLEKRSSDGLSEKKIKKFIERADKDILRLSRLIEDMVEVTFNESQSHADYLWFNLEDFMDEFAHTAAACFPNFHEIVTLEVQSPVMVYWDHQKIEKVLINLLSNAYRYGNNSPIHITLKAGGNQVYITVKDSGPGIQMEDQKRIFEMFERNNTQGNSGLGLGLFVCQKIVKEHGGSIQLTSSPGAGAVFEIRLPVKFM